MLSLDGAETHFNKPETIISYCLVTTILFLFGGDKIHTGTSKDKHLHDT